MQHFLLVLCILLLIGLANYEHRPGLAAAGAPAVLAPPVLPLPANEAYEPAWGPETPGDFSFYGSVIDVDNL